MPSTPLPGGTYTPAATATSGLTPTFSITAGDTAVCTLSSGVVTFDATGTCTITATQTGDSRYAAAATQTQTITVGALNQTINVTIPDDVNYGTPGFTLDTDTTSALDVTVTPTNSDICTITGLIVTPVDIGDCELTITQAGNSSYAAASPVTINFRILPTVPTAPTITSVSAGNANATIAFTAPGFTGGVNLSAYTITATPTTGDPINNTSCTTSPCTITGLANGTDYTLTITANNTAGAGPASTPSPAVTPATRATAVTTLAATPRDSTINVTWDEPDNFGGGTFIRYELRVTAAGEAMPTNATAMITDASVGAHTLTGLDNGTAYDVEVVTITSANQTAITGNTATLSTVPVSTPAAPTDVGVNTISPRVIHLAWAEPERNGGAPVSGYVVTITGGDGTSVECGTITIVDGARTADCTSALLQLSTTYTITIAAENRIGTGAAASVTHTTPTFTAPTTPPDITIDDDTECPCLFDADGNPVPVDIERTEPGVTPGSVTIDDGVIALGDTTTRPGHATTWVDADGQLVAQTPGSLPLSGSNALPGTTVTIFVDGVAAGTATVNPDGTWTLDLDLPDGINGTITMTIVWIDENGEQRTLTTPLTIIATGDAATAPRTTSNSTQLAPGPDSVIATGPNGELLDSTRNVDSTGNSVIVTAGDSVVRISPAENGRIDPTGRLVLTHPSRVRVTGDNMLPGATATIWVMSSPQQLGTVIVAADGTIDATYAIPTGIDPGDHTIQIDTADANGRALSIAMGLTITTGVLPVTGASTHSHLAWLTLMLALGALTALTASGHRRQRGAPRH
ncbi:MAG: beta strand repeat-containing protein [Ilumatobacteraceae bacterium]